MLGMRYIRENANKVREYLKNRNSDFDLDGFLKLDEERRTLLYEVETLKKERNESSTLIGKYKKEGKDTEKLMERMQEVSSKIKELDQKVAEIDEKQLEYSYTIPNKLHETTPIGTSEDDNVEIKKWGEPRKFSFEPKSHDELGISLGILDFERGSKIGGSRFTVYKNAAAKLERALINFMLDTHTTEHGYEEMLTPQLVKREMMVGTGQLPKFADDAYKIENEEMYLIPTAEVTLTNYHNGEILAEEDLPKYYCGFTACFRKEAGSGGKDLKGLIRQHQFNKVEMVKLAHPKNSYEELEKMVENAEKILQKLELPYRVLSLCSGDIGFGSAKTYDLEVWVPSQDKYREISSCSNTEDFQARRAMIKYREKETGKSYFVHTLNGSGLAVGRTLLAIMENYQQEDGSIKIPEVLVSYMGGMTVIK
ncbi:MAG: serine--tRNA ligase [Leptotrichiaceae bacterium]|nr:serine--tRNA ligase [Leptotrichiaceae bacterium]MBP6281814.1 serine--tRNA ligase [Leptotrichiaceae bacterium]MBP7100694.1 serine--tRNA ligase [Leptotrichiaceae bacterium]MBP7739469.1 serine--tRNA ligase [Leptotrichiaceae bacterium]MBP9629786.1 serine--tRNA ligase [Leptotrichiaceae bacterium]